jgi:arsenate reductase-like glutaredoxin family protein
MNKDQIEKLIDDANLSSTASFRIREWFVQNPIAPTVVGLSDEQMTDISNYLWKNMSIFTPQHCNNLLIHWAKTQTFSKSEVKEVQVGLSDEQIVSFISFQQSNKGLHYQEAYKEWAKTQTFAQPPQFTPNWDDAPKSATSCQVTRVWLDALGIPVEFKVLIDEQRPNPPAPSPVVEVWQVWKEKKEPHEITIVAIGKNKIYDTICYQYTESRVIEIRCNDDFLAKFERVGGE